MFFMKNGKFFSFINEKVFIFENFIRYKRR